MKCLILAASLRQESLNKKLAQLMAKILTANKHEIEIVDFASVIAPIYNGDIEVANGLPQGALYFIERLKNADGLIIVSPEYNYSIPGSLKNLIDWVSRVKPMPLAKFPVMLASASPSVVGGSRGLLHTLVTLQAACGVMVFPQMFTLAQADQAFDANGELIDKKLQGHLEKDLSGFSEFVLSQIK